MANNVYDKLADALGKLPNGFPRTPSNVEIPLLQKLFSPEEAHLASQLGADLEPVDEISERIGIETEKVVAKLLRMAKRGLVWVEEPRGKPRFRLAPFIFGIFEFQLKRMDHQLAHLVEDYMLDGGAAGIMGVEPAIHRVVPAKGTVKTEWILPYEDVQAILDSAKTFRVQDCVCRVQMDKLDRRCKFPLKVCLNYSSKERPPSRRDITREEAMEILDKAEEVGLVHSVCNVREGGLWSHDLGIDGYICNCCGCCCALLRGITELGIENSVADSIYYAEINPEECLGCWTCIERCQVQAISEQGEVAFVDRKRCIGCGLCVTGCPNEAAQLQRKPDTDIRQPPLDFSAWEKERRLNRGMAEQV